MRELTAAVLLTLSFGLASAAESPMPIGSLENVAGGTRLVSPQNASMNDFNVRLGDGKFGTHSVDEDLLSIEVTSQPENTWDASFGVATTAKVQAGDILVVGFEFRGQATDGSGGAVAEFVFERGGDPYTKSVQYLAETESAKQWQTVWVRFKSKENYEAGKALCNFQLGYQKQTLQVRNFVAWNFGQDYDLESLPNTEMTYAGRSIDANWRTAAEKRIDELRRCDVTLSVVNLDRQLDGKLAHVRLNRHDFDFGTAVSVPMVDGEGPDHVRYREVLQKNFNAAVIENGLKWSMWDDGADPRTATLRTLGWLQQKNIPARGHVMVWPAYKNSPDWLPAIGKDPTAFGQVVDSRIREVGLATRGLVRDWDVMNEAFDNQDFFEILGQEAMVHWFKVADEVAPDVDLYYNDYAGLVRGGFPTGHKDHFEKTVRYLKDNGAPIDGIGIQGHFGALPTSPSRLLAELDRWHALGLKVLITEYDMTAPDESLKADFTRDFLTVCFSHPAVAGVLTWGFWEGAHWMPEAAFFKRDWTVTPMGRQWIDLTQKVWTTDQDVSIDSTGQIKFRGYVGDYTLTIGEINKRFRVRSDGGTEWLGD